MKARYPGRCPACSRPVRVGQELARRDPTWVHAECARAKDQNDRAVSRILEGVELKGRKPSPWRMGASPSSGGSGRWTGGRKRGHTRGIRKMT